MGSSRIYLADIVIPARPSIGRDVSSPVDLTFGVAAPILEAGVIKPSGIAGQRVSFGNFVRDGGTKPRKHVPIFIPDVQFSINAPGGVGTVFDINLQFGGGVEPPGEDQIIYSGGWATGVFEIPVFRHQYRFLFPQGQASTAIYGRPFVELYDREVRPSGYVASLYGRPTVRSLRSYITGRGFDTSLYGKPGVILRNRTLTLAGINAPYVGGVSLVELSQRYLGPLAITPPALIYDYMRVSNFNREVKPPSFGLDVGFPGYAFGRPNVWTTTRWLRPLGLHSVGWGGPKLSNEREVLQPKGLVATFYGTAWVSLHRRSVTGAGRIEPIARVGLPWVSAYERDLFTAGIRATLWGQAAIADRTKYPVAKGFLSNTFGQARFYSEYQFVTGRGFSPQVVPQPIIRLGVRYIYPNWIYSYKSGYGWLDYGLRSLTEATAGGGGIVASRAWIAFLTQARNIQGFDSAVVSPYAVIQDPLRSVLAKPILLENLQRPTVFNVDTYTTPAVFSQGQKGETEFNTPWVTHRNRALYPSGVNNLRIGVGVSIHFFVADVDSAGLGDAFRLGALLIAFRIRTVVPAGVISSHVASTLHIRNLGLGVRPESVVAGEVSRAKIEVANRTYKIPTVTPDDVVNLFGSTMISFAVRALSDLSATHKASSYVGVDAWVSLRMRFVQPAAIQIPVVERFDTEVISRFTYIKPFNKIETNTPFGEAFIHLYDRNVYPKLVVAPEPSVPTVVHRNRTYTIGMSDLTRFGSVRIADRRLFVELFNKGFAPPAWTKKHSIVNLERDPPSLQKIFAQGYWRFDQDVFPGSKQVPEPLVGVQSVFDAGNIDSMSVGEAALWSNAIIVEAGIWNNYIGIPRVSPNFIYPESLGEHLGASSLAEPFVGPYRIYAPFSDQAPERYIPFDKRQIDNHVIDGRKYRNHNASSNSYNGTKIGTAWVPRPSVTYWVQGVISQGTLMQRFGTTVIYIPGVGGQRQFITARGINSLRVGWLHFPPDIIMVDPYLGFAAGRATVRSVPSNILRPGGFTSYAMGRPLVDFYNRFLTPRGWGSRVIGTQWASFRVRSFKPSGIASKGVIPALHYIDFKIRHIKPLGEDYLNPPEAFTGKPTMVRNRYTGQVLNAKTFVSYAVGQHAIAERTQYLAPRALFAVPLFPPTVKGRTEIQALGAEHTEFGHVRKYEEGVVYPHEFKLAGFGRAFVVTSREVQGFDSAVVECPVIAKHVGAYGTPGEQFGVTVFTNEVCCEGCG